MTIILGNLEVKIHKNKPERGRMDETTSLQQACCEGVCCKARLHTSPRAFSLTNECNFAAMVSELASSLPTGPMDKEDTVRRVKQKDNNMCRCTKEEKTHAINLYALELEFK